VGLPLDVVLRELRVTDLRVGEGQGPPLLEEGRLVARFVDGRLTLESLSLTAPRGRLEAEGGLTARDAYPLELAARWRATLPGLAPLEGVLELEGALRDALQLEHRLTGAGTLVLAGTVTDPVASPALDLTLTARDVDPRKLGESLPSVPVEGALTLAGTPADLRLGGGLQVEVPGAGPVDVTVAATGNATGARI
jgi:hypothetical protein